MLYKNQKKDKQNRIFKKSLNFARELCLRLKAQFIQQNQLTHSDTDTSFFKPVQFSNYLFPHVNLSIMW